MNKSYVYIISNKHHNVLYTGVTSDLLKRVFQHKTKYFPRSFASRYNCGKLVFYTEFDDINDAIEFEKKIKAGSRKKKEKLIVEMNSEWKDLAEDWIFNF